MAQQHLDLAPGGDKVGEAFTKVESNLIELFALAAIIASVQSALPYKQPLDDDLTAIAAQGTQAFGRSLLAKGSDADVRSALSLGSAALLAAGFPGGAATLDASTGKVLASQIPDALLGSVRYQGGWNASTNSPTLPVPSSANKGWYYIVLTAGTTSLQGPNGSISDWQLGDWAVSDGTFWEKIDSSDQVISVAGLQGVVTALALTANLLTFVGDTGTGGTKGLVPAPAAGDSAAGKFLRADGSFAVPPSSSGTVPGDKTITNAKLADVPANTIKGNNTATAGSPVDASLSSFLDLFSSAQGAVLYRGTGAWVALAPGAAGAFLASGGTGANPGYTPAAVASEIRAATDTLKPIVSAALIAALAPVSWTYAATYTPDMATFFNADMTLTGNLTLANPTNAKAGQPGEIFLQQDATGGRTVAFGSAWKFVGGTPTASTAANAVDVISYRVRSTSPLLIVASYGKGVA